MVSFMWWNSMSIALSVIPAVPGMPAASKDETKALEQQEKTSRGPAASMVW
jgi:hypothetical protein